MALAAVQPQLAVVQTGRSLRLGETERCSALRTPGPAENRRSQARKGVCRAGSVGKLEGSERPLSARRLRQPCTVAT